MTYLKNFLTVVLLLTTAACGGKYEVEVSGNVNLTVDISQITSAFKIECRKELGPDASDAQVNSCANQRLAEFLQALEAAMAAGGT